MPLNDRHFGETESGPEKSAAISLSHLPILTRGEVVKQVAAEGPLISPGDRNANGKTLDIRLNRERRFNFLHRR